MNGTKVPCRNVDELVERLKTAGIGFHIDLWGQVRDQQGRCPLCAAGEVFLHRRYTNPNFALAAEDLGMSLVEASRIVGAADCANAPFSTRAKLLELVADHPPIGPLLEEGTTR